MRRDVGIRAATAAVAASLLLGVPAGAVFSRTAGAAAYASTVTRISGTDRYATAAAIAEAGWPGALPAGSTLLLATGSTYPDAVAGAAAAGHLDVPLLLTLGTDLSPSAADQISRLKPAKVALLGGTAAISDTVAAQVAALGPSVVRWDGADRYATAAAISQATYTGAVTNVYLATGDAFPDALAGAALAAVAGGPLLLTTPTELPQETATELTRLHPAAIVILGGTSAVSDQVAQAAVAAAGGAQVSRLSGADRYETADAVASVLVQVHGGSTASRGMVLATGRAFPDALAGAAWAGATGRPLLLVPTNYVTVQTWQTIQALAPPTTVVIGGAAAVSASVVTGLMDGDPPTSPPASASK